MKLYDTLTAKKVTFKPLHKKNVGMYVCGPTVYDLPHLGHGRSAVAFDVIRKYLIYKNYQVTYVTNYTDIEDKMIARAEILKISVEQLAQKIIPEYAKDYQALGILEGDVQPKATDHVGQMISLINDLEKKGCTYILDDGVYYDITKFTDYGKLSKQKLSQLKSGIRVTLKESKKNPQDFVLWKFSKKGEPSWKSPWGEGRPGWHIECSAMSREYLGKTFDIHGGGADLIFPHHECEIAQSEAANEKPFAKYWLHNGFIRINNEKMSKSLGNFFTLRDIFAKYNPQAVRFLFLQTHYRSPIDFSDEVLQQTKNSLERLHDFIRRLKDFSPSNKTESNSEVKELLISKRAHFEAGMDNDFDTSIALAAVFEVVKTINRQIDHKTLSQKDKDSTLKLMQELDAILGIIFPKEKAQVDQKIIHLINMREEARKTKNWAKSDQIRNELLKMGIKLEDSSEGTIWKKI